MRIADYFDTAASRYPLTDAVVFGDVRITFRDAQRFIHAVGHALVRESILSDNAHIAIYSGNEHRVPLLQLGINRADKTWIGVHSRNSVETNAEVLAYCDCELMFYNSYFEAQIPELHALLPSVKKWICIDRDSAYGQSLDQWLEGCWTPFAYTRPDMERTACLIPTGGTTGKSKGVLHSHRSMEMQLINASSSLEMVENSRLLSIAPLSHAAGNFSFGFIPNGGTHVIVPEFNAELVLKTIEAERITHVFMPPTMVYALLAHPLSQQTNFSSLRCLLIGAAPTAPDKFKEAVRLFGPVLVEAYAQSETLLPILLKRPSDYLLADGTFDEDVLPTAGKAVPFVRVEIMDDEGRLVQPGERGEIVVRASMGMTGYYNLPEATREVSFAGFHRTGDVGVMNDRGFITIVDRKKDMIITGAFNVYPAEIEAVIYKHHAVLDCIVIGVPDEKWGEAVKAIVELKSGAVATEAEVIALCRDKLGGVKTPKSVEFWETLPRSAVGKLLRREARKRFWEGQWRSV